MADVHSREVRSYNMSRIKGKDTKPELLVRKYLHFRGLRYRLHVKDLPGKPDMVFPKYHTVLFVHGCFWHGHAGCPYYRLPQSNTGFWEEKISGNTSRDQKHAAALREKGYRVLTAWECSFKNKNNRTAFLEELYNEITNER
ncbi:DNA mismatch endonuclease Vsr [Mucilaginibacter conchicola]|uniref:Very short patch repair endonuclease n=1 Tax=Mucilaginibacter conchicola TaxID=2303333 RepID=A0A372NQB0_9SPHI|nr:very short patch repair endonuclease [Mucilaginibacter conchicola]RFZ91112.1 DNA mismatch endonuclease Vsr [Mucilaginibacter conchicola]